MRAQVTKMFRFEAAHHLPNHDGKCRHPHGHSYKVVVTCNGSINAEEHHPKEGMVVDFSDIKKAWEEIVLFLDHQDLNRTLKYEVPVTTAENIACWICSQFTRRGFSVKEIQVWETETSFASVQASDVWIHQPLAVLKDELNHVT